MNKNNVAIIWTTAYCPYCYLTKELLKSNNISYIENQINDEYSKKLYLQKFPNTNNNIIVPKIILNNNLIEGYDNLLIYLKREKIYNREKTPFKTSKIKSKKKSKTKCKSIKRSKTKCKSKKRSKPKCKSIKNKIGKGTIFHKRNKKLELELELDPDNFRYSPIKSNKPTYHFYGYYPDFEERTSRDFRYGEYDFLDKEDRFDRDYEGNLADGSPNMEGIDYGDHHE